MFKCHKLFLLSLSLSVLGITVNAQASELTIPNMFTAGTPARAAEVNDNFNAVKTAVDDNDGRIAELETENGNLAANVTILETANTQLGAANADLTARLEALENFIGQLQQRLSLETDNQGNPVVIFSGVNVHINNGEGQTGTVNGLGNLIVGYDEMTTRTTALCSNGQFDNETDCTNNNGVWWTSHKSGSHNVVIGVGHNYSQYGGLLAGLQNTVNGPFATVSGGAANIASSAYASVSGGALNTASGASASVSGGARNTASGAYSSVTGGFDNTARGTESSVSGGSGRSATGTSDWVAGSLLEDL